MKKSESDIKTKNVKKEGEEEARLLLRRSRLSGLINKSKSGKIESEKSDDKNENQKVKVKKDEEEARLLRRSRLAGLVN